MRKGLEVKKTNKGKGVKKNAKVLIANQLQLHKELGFGEIMKATNLSKRAVNTTLDTLEAQNIVTKGKGSRGKWHITESGQDRFAIEGLVNQIQSCGNIAIQSPDETTASLTTLLYEVIKTDDKANAPKKNPNSNNPYKENNFIMAELDVCAFDSRLLGTHSLDLTPKEIKEIARREEIVVLDDDEALKEKVLEALSKRVRKIVLVEVFDPALMLKKMRRVKELKDPLMALDCLIDQCPECGSKNLIKDNSNGEIVCKNCGIVLRVDAQKRSHR